MRACVGVRLHELASMAARCSEAKRRRAAARARAAGRCSAARVRAGRGARGYTERGTLGRYGRTATSHKKNSATCEPSLIKWPSLFLP